MFSVDKDEIGKKKFLIKTYDELFHLINNSNQNHYYEDQSNSNNIKLHLDIDYNKSYTCEMNRDKDCDEILNDLLPTVETKIKKIFNINTPKTIILISKTLDKLSLHTIYVDIIFTDIFHMRDFMSDIDYIDKAIYRRGCFRMLHCSKFNKNNHFVFYKSINYNFTNNYQLFIDSCICSDKITNPISYNIEKESNKKINYILKNT